MPLALQGDDPTLPVYGSARDVGNIAAGLVAGRFGLCWGSARYGFDWLETGQQQGGVKAFFLYPFFGVINREGSSTQYGERLGYRIGCQIGYIERNIQLRKLPSYGGVPIPNINVSNRIIKRSDYTPWK